MSTFLELTNDVLRHFNEVELTSANFASATGFQNTVKDYVNDAIREVQQAEYEWPFNWHSTTQVGTLNSAPNVYSLPTDCESVDWESFMLVRDDNLTNPVSQKWLPYKDYDYWLQNDAANDYNQVGQTLGVQPPKYVYRTQDQKFGFSPIFDQAYTIYYEYWGYPSELSAYGDTTTIPSRFDHVIRKGAISKGYSFRGNMPMSKLYKDQFDAGISKMRELLINRYKTLRDGRVRRSG